MSLPTNLVTNEVKDSAAAEVEFNRLSTEGRKVMFAKNGEVPNAPYRITVSHSEVGAGVTLRRRSLVRIDKTISGVSTQPRVVSAYIVLDAPIGDISATTELKNAIANLLSLCATTGAATTVLFDCSGYGADALVNGSL